MTSRAKKTTLREIRDTWPPTVDVSVGAKPLGVSRSSAYESIKNGTFPVATIRVGHRIRILTEDLIRVLTGGDGAT
jgi:hypothetical protein